MLSNPDRWDRTENAGTSAERRRDFSAAVLITANLIPMVGVMFLHWEVFPLMLLYWLENVVVGAFNVLRLAVSAPDDMGRWIAKVFFIPFFCVHYGGFAFVHGMFLMFFFGHFRIAEPSNLPGLVVQAVRQTHVGFALLAMVLSHGLSFVTHFIHGREFMRVSLRQLMIQPYQRVVVLHLAVLGGGVAVMFLGSPLVALIVLIAIKTVIDVRAHRAEHDTLASRPAEVSVRPKLAKIS